MDTVNSENSPNKTSSHIISLVQNQMWQVDKIVATSIGNRLCIGYQNW